MLRFSEAKDVEFLPDDDARAWLAEGLGELGSRLGEPASRPRVLGAPPIEKPRDLDAVFELVCLVQAEVGQRDVDFALVELDHTRNGGGAEQQLPPGFAPLGDPSGQLMHTFARGDELALVVVPALLKVPALVHASIARELGRIAIHRAGGHAVEPEALEADAEIAAILLGMGVWVANGAYVYENACCGGGCGLDLKSMRTGLSMPEACFGLALDLQRKGIAPRHAAKHLESTQRAAFKKSASWLERKPELLALASPGKPALASS